MESNDKLRYQIRLRGMDDIREFVNEASHLEGKCELISGRYRVDAKSLISVFTLPIRGEMVVEVEQEQTELPEQMQKFIL